MTTAPTDRQLSMQRPRLVSGGIAAKRGFDYQDTVTLDLLFDHFDKHGPSATVRPEGEEDIDLRWVEDGIERCRFVQVKKPTDDAQANPNPSPWSLREIARDLLRRAVSRLADNSHEQVWVLGDELGLAARLFFEARAARGATSAYWAIVHELARSEALSALPDGSGVAKAAMRYRLPKKLPENPAETRVDLAAAAGAFGRRFGTAGAVFARRYEEEVTRLDDLFPGILDRIEIMDANGTEADVEQRVKRKLEQRYGLAQSIVDATLFRNLRGFISDVAKRLDRCFDHAEFEEELRCVWPRMVPIKTPPSLDNFHLARPVLAAVFTDQWSGAAVEVVGISGSGKTMLAAEILARSQQVEPDRVGFYAEVRPDVSLRDCLTGAAFRLRRLHGVMGPFAEAIQYDRTDEDVLTALAKTFSELTRKCLLVLDLVTGEEPAGFTRHIASFIRSLSSDALRVVVFGQKAGLRELTGLEYPQFKVRRIDTPGLSFEEFVKLAERHHRGPDRRRLGEIYHRITAGRESGMNVNLAQILIRAQTIDEMAATAALPPESRLAHAEQQRFGLLSQGARPAAEKLTCFALPFRRSEAEAVFPKHNVGQAIRELLDIGLLRRRDGETFEMHETVRAGLEDSIAPEKRRHAHIALAGWYGSQGQTVTPILHLDRAGRTKQAHALVRESFLAGENCPSLWPYVARHRLVTASEVLCLLAGPLQAEGLTHLLRDIANDLAAPSFPGALLDLVRTQIARVLKDPQWARSIFEAIVAAEPSSLNTLIEILIGGTSDVEVAANALRWLQSVTLHQKVEFTQLTLTLFDRQSETIQGVLLGFLLRGGRRALKHAFQHLANHPKLTGEGGRHLMLSLNTHSFEDVADVLAVLPSAEPNVMAFVRGPYLGIFDDLIWRARRALRPGCIKALREQSLDGDLLANAIRILLFLGDSTVLDLCKSLSHRNDKAGTLAALAPAIVPALMDWRPFEARVLDLTLEFADRCRALVILGSSGRPVEDLLDRLRTADPQAWPRWESCFRLIAASTPFAAAIPVLEAALASAGRQRDPELAAIMFRQGLAPGDKATQFLLRALTNLQHWVRECAAVTMTFRRDREALPQLIECYEREQYTNVYVPLAVAIASSGATSAADVAAHSGIWQVDYWSTVVAHRTRDLNLADRLVALATDPNQLWTVRRAAIAASGRLPYEAVLERIEASVMADRSPFTLDHHPCRVVHAVMTNSLPMAVFLMRSVPIPSQDEFIKSFALCFDRQLQEYSMAWVGTSAGSDAAAWLYQQLASAGWPAGDAEIERLNNDLRKPLLQAAVLRALRLCNRPDRIDAYLAAADHVWLVIRGLAERVRLPERGPGLGRRLRDLVAGTPWGDDRLVKYYLDQLARPPSDAVTPPGVPPPPAEPAVTGARLTYETAFRLLSLGVGAAAPEGFLTIEPLTIEQCKKLIDLAHPTNDPQRGETVFTSEVSFNREGHSVGRLSTTIRGGPSLPARLRLAIAAANRFGLPMPWHTLQPGDLVSDAYAESFLSCLAAQNDESRFYAALADNEEALMLALCRTADALPPQFTIDSRLIPAMIRLLAVGTDDLFKGLCILAKRIDVPEIVLVLEGLLHRWAQRFGLTSAQLQHKDSHALWHGFARLCEHPRFGEIQDWPRLLTRVLLTPIARFRAQAIVRVLEQDSGSYSLMEARLMQEENWEHHPWDEVDRLDRAAEMLFRQTRDGCDPKP